MNADALYLSSDPAAVFSLATLAVAGSGVRSLGMAIDGSGESVGEFNVREPFHQPTSPTGGVAASGPTGEPDRDAVRRSDAARVAHSVATTLARSEEEPHA